VLPEGWSYVPPAELGEGPALALSAMCPMSLAGSSADMPAGIPLPLLRECCRELGCIRAADGHLYGCSSSARLLAFASAPAAALEGVRRQALRHPLLVHLLGLQQAAPQCNLHALLAAPAQPVHYDFGTQTPTHFVEQHIDRGYEWNAWALRRRALALADLKSKRTHSTQTAESHFRRDGQTQVGPPAGFAGTIEHVG
jgi:hypothetical protein